jgi:hypothetical protein
MQSNNHNLLHNHDLLHYLANWLLEEDVWKLRGINTKIKQIIETESCSESHYTNCTYGYNGDKYILVNKISLKINDYFYFLSISDGKLDEASVGKLTEFMHRYMYNNQYFEIKIIYNTIKSNVFYNSQYCNNTHDYCFVFIPVIYQKQYDFLLKLTNN